MFFKVKIGYNPSDFISIESLNDLEKAQYAFLTNAKVIFDNGQVCRGQDIISIKEDWHREMGWNKTFRDENGNIKNYELSSEDWKEIKKAKVDQKYLGIMETMKQRVQYLVDKGKSELVGKGIDIQLPEKPKELSAASLQLANKFKI